MWAGHTVETLDLNVVGPVTEEWAVIWATSLFGGAVLQPAKLLISVLSDFLETEEAMIHEGTHEIFIDKDAQIQEVVSSWLNGRAVSAAYYAVDLLQNATPVDSLFLLLALAWANIHAGVLHSEGLWSSRIDGS